MVIMKLEGRDKMKNPVTSSEIESVTFWRVADCVGHSRYRSATGSVDGLAPELVRAMPQMDPPSHPQRS
jgi:hypothetical protein